jgi:2-phospho-L-lactate guanylyltransferase
LRTNNKNSNIWVIMPVKPLTQAKSRLGTALSVTERQALAEKLLLHSLEILAGATYRQIISGFLVISRDENALALTKQHNGLVLRENQIEQDNLNAALRQASLWLEKKLTAWNLLILPADLPLLALEDLQAIITQSQAIKYGAIIVPDHHKSGTNLLLLKPYNLLNQQYHFGENSYSKHLETLTRLGVPVTTIENPHLAFDLDYPADLLNFSKWNKS